MQTFISNLNMHTLSLLAIVSGLVIVCMGMWYIWSSQQQIQTDVLFLQAQYAQLTGKGISKATVAPTGTGPSENTLTRALAADGARFSEQHTAGGCDAATSGDAVCAFPANTVEPSVLHRSGIALQTTAQSAALEQDGSDTSSDSESDYDDDDDDDDEDRCEADRTLGGNEHNMQVVAAVDEVGVGVQVSAAEADASAETSNIVNSLLSNMVSETIDQIMPASSAVSFLSVDASAMGNLVSSSGDVTTVVLGAVAAPTEPAGVVVEEVGEMAGGEVTYHASEAADVSDEPVASAIAEATTPAEDIASTTSSVPENLFDCQGDPKLLSETLHAKTVTELKQLCGTCDVGIKKGRAFKRKAELIDDLVQKVCG